MLSIQSFSRAFALTMVLIVSGCASSGTQIDQSNLAQIEQGVTTKEQMYALFGSPLSQAYGSDGKLSMVWHYIYVGPFGTGMKQQNLAVIFDDNDVVEKYNMVNSAGNGVRFGL